MTKKRTVWLSKYALTAGIKEVNADIRGDSAYPGAPYASFTSYVMGKDAHETRDMAVMAAEAARKKKLASLKKQVAALEALKF